MNYTMICAKCKSIAIVSEDVFFIDRENPFKCNRCLNIKCRICAGIDVYQIFIVDTFIRPGDFTRQRRAAERPSAIVTAFINAINPEYSAPRKRRKSDK